MVLTLWVCSLFLTLSQPNEDETVLGLLLKAEYASLTRDFERALKLSEQAMTQNPNSADAVFLNIEVLRELQKNQSTSSVRGKKDLLLKLSRATKTFPEDYRFVQALGIMLAAETKWTRLQEFDTPDVYLERAAILMEKAEPSRQDWVETYHYLGRWYVNQDRNFEASEAFNQLYHQDTSLTWALYLAGESYQNSHQLRSALRAYSQYVAEDKDDRWTNRPTLVLNMAMIRVMLTPNQANMNNLNKALENLELGDYGVLRIAARFISVGRFAVAKQLLETYPSPNASGDHVRLSLQVAFAQRRYREALDMAKRASSAGLDLRTNTFLLDYGLEAALLTGAYEEGLNWFEGLAKRAPTSPWRDILVALSEYLAKGSDIYWQALLVRYQGEEFSGQLKQEVEEFGLKATVISHLVGIFQEQNDWQGALKLLSGVTDLDNPSLAFLEEVAEVYAVAGEYDQAFPLLDRLIEKRPKEAGLYNNFAYFLAESGSRLDQAHDLVKRALALEPESPDFLDTLAWILYRKGQFEEAQTVLQKALSVDEEDAEKLDHMGDILHAQGKTDEAKAFWSRAMVHARDAYFAILDKLDPAGEAKP